MWKFGEIMAGSSRNIVDELIVKFRKLSDLCIALERENGTLKEQLTLQKEELNVWMEKCEAWEKRYQILKHSRSVVGDNTSDTEETKARFAKLVREIDKCISLLNE